MEYVKNLPADLIRQEDLSQIRSLIGRHNMPYECCFKDYRDGTFGIYTKEPLLVVDLKHKVCTIDRDTKRGVKWANKITNFLQSVA